MPALWKRKPGNFSVQIHVLQLYILAYQQWKRQQFSHLLCTAYQTQPISKLYEHSTPALSKIWRPFAPCVCSRESFMFGRPWQIHDQAQTSTACPFLTFPGVEWCKWKGVVYTYYYSTSRDLPWNLAQLHYLQAHVYSPCTNVLVLRVQVLINSVVIGCRDTCVLYSRTVTISHASCPGRNMYQSALLVLRSYLTNALPLCFPVHINYRFPVNAVEESERWKKILQVKLNAKCRALRVKDEPGHWFMNLVCFFPVTFSVVFPMCISLQHMQYFTGDWPFEYARMILMRATKVASCVTTQR